MDVEVFGLSEGFVVLGIRVGFFFVVDFSVVGEVFFGAEGFFIVCVVERFFFVV